MWAIDSTVTGRFVIEIEFLDLKIADPSVSTVSLSSSHLSMFGTTTIRIRGVKSLTHLKSCLIYSCLVVKINDPDK